MEEKIEEKIDVNYYRKKYKDFDNSFLYGYYDETGVYIGVFRKETPPYIITYAKKVFGEIEFE